MQFGILIDLINQIWCSCQVLEGVLGVIISNNGAMCYYQLRIILNSEIFMGGIICIPGSLFEVFLASPDIFSL